MLKALLTSAFVLAAAPALAVTVTGDAILGGSSAGLDLSNQQTTGTDIKVYTEKDGLTSSHLATYVVGVNRNVGDSWIGGSTGSAALVDRWYSSWLIHFDGLGNGAINGDPVDEASAVIDFGRTIIAIISYQPLLEATDPLFGEAAVYADPNRGTETGDQFTLLNATTLSIDLLRSGTAPDNIRVLAAIPLPATGLLLLGGLGMMVAARRRMSAA